MEDLWVIREPDFSIDPAGTLRHGLLNSSHVGFEKLMEIWQPASFLSKKNPAFFAYLTDFMISFFQSEIKNSHCSVIVLIVEVLKNVRERDKIQFVNDLKQIEFFEANWIAIDLLKLGCFIFFFLKQLLE